MNLTADASQARLDKYLSAACPGYSRGYFQKLIKAGKVTVNGSAVTPHAPVKPGDRISIEFAVEPKDIVPEQAALDILYEDEDILVINKAPGMVVHPACGHPGGTLLNALFGRAAGSYTPLLVHRLDKDTSGVMLVAKNEKAKSSLVKQFESRRIKKVYLAAVTGCVGEERGYIEAPLGRSAADRKKISVGPLAKKAAITEFKVMRRCSEFSLLEVYPRTGRTHQIRSHLVYIGHPVLGDAVYGGALQAAGRPVRRQMLHAYRIELTHPRSCRNREFSAPLPRDMEELWKGTTSCEPQP